MPNRWHYSRASGRSHRCKSLPPREAGKALQGQRVREHLDTPDLLPPNGDARSPTWRCIARTMRSSSLELKEAIITKGTKKNAQA
ncbi:hypothetical protein BJX76DRAFT_344299 [Aspergillus varians]